MRRLVMMSGSACVAVLLALSCWLPARALGAPVSTISLGAEASVTVTVASKSADAVLGLEVFAPVSTRVCSACGVGATAALGTFGAGTEIVLRLWHATTWSYLSTTPTHARIEQSGDNWRVNWDDANADGDFDDLVVIVSATRTQPPEPTPTPPPDRDGDGASPPADCMDTNSLVYPGAPEVAGNGLDEDCVGGDAPGRVLATIKTSWVFGRRSTRVKLMEVRNAPAGATIALACRGSRCPFRKRTVHANRLGTKPLTPLFRPRPLRVGARLEIAITAPNTIGRVVRYRIRSNNFPRQQERCLPPGVARPVPCPPGA